MTTCHLTSFRRHLHSLPELSGCEANTAEIIKQTMQKLNPDQVFENLGGHGLAFVFDSGVVGKRILFRCELDALPIQELNDFAHRSKHDGVSHKCGHDGHMAIIYALAERINQNRPKTGAVIFLFQPAEETGEGARAVVAESLYQELAPDYCFALHNLPSHPMGQVLIRSGTFNCASRGMTIRLTGKTAHAAYPETGISPAPAMADLVKALPDLPKQITADELLMATVVHAQVGEQAFGTAPADACVMVTLRSESNQGMEQLVTLAESYAQQMATEYSLQCEITYADVFDASVNDRECAERVADAAQQVGNDVKWLDEPFRWSEDFGAISATAKGAMFALGAGETNPQIHNPDYDFPDELIEQGANIFYRIYQNI